MRAIFFLFAGFWLGVPTLWAADYRIPRPDSESPFIDWLEPGVTADFCAEWNPEFAYNGGRCCREPRIAKHGRRYIRVRGCSSHRAKESFCDEVTPTQKNYIQDVRLGKADPISQIESDRREVEEQAFCSVNNGFLAYGRPLVATQKNRILLRRPDRCVQFGADKMVAMLEWLGQQVNDRYPPDSEWSGVSMVVGDISAPKGSCLGGGRKGHASHTNGVDVDLGFLVVRRGGESTDRFITNLKEFQPEPNLWLIKQVFKNPFTCIHRVFLDHRLIEKLDREAAGDSEYQALRPSLQHIPGHRNHFHIRIGKQSTRGACRDSE